MANFHEKIALAEEELETMKSKVCAKEKEILQMKEIASKVELALDECYDEDSCVHCLDEDAIRRVLEKLIRENHALKKSLAEEPIKKVKICKKEPKHIEIRNKIKNRGFKEDCCQAVVWKFEGRGTYTPRTISQCRKEPTDTGLCKGCQKSWDKNGGFLRNGRLKSGMTGDEVIEEGFFGESAHSFAAGHQKWCADFTNPKIVKDIKYL